jgi:ABC-2 type transport system ATP-binding protein
LRRAADRSATVLVSSHLLTELEQIADDVVILDRRVLWAGARQDMPNDRAGGLEELYRTVGATRWAA